jgi:hypothetical protein
MTFAPTSSSLGASHKQFAAATASSKMHLMALFISPSLYILVLPFLTSWRLWMRPDLLPRASSSTQMTIAAAVPAAATLAM